MYAHLKDSQPWSPSPQAERLQRAFEPVAFSLPLSHIITAGQSARSLRDVHGGYVSGRQCVKEPGRLVAAFAGVSEEIGAWHDRLIWR